MTTHHITNEEFLRTAAKEIRSRGKRVVSNIIEIGQLLVECKKRIARGGWLTWLENEFGWSERTAQYFMSVYAMMVGKNATIADLENIAPAALYELAAKSTPDTIRSEMLTRARQGERISQRTVIEAQRPAIRSVSLGTDPPLMSYKIVGEEPTVSPRVVSGTDLLIALYRRVAADLDHVIHRLHPSGPAKVTELLETARQELEAAIAEMEAKQKARRH